MISCNPINRPPVPIKEPASDFNDLPSPPEVSANEDINDTT